MIQTANGQQLAMISVPWQEYVTPMMPAEALVNGTVFSNLNQTYVPTIFPPVSTQSAVPVQNTMPSTQNMNSMPNMNTMQMQNMNMQKKR